MNDAEREIDTMLTSIGKELTNIKTAHQRPLGALDFFTETETITLSLPSQYGTYSLDFYIDVRVQESGVKPPIVQVGWDTPSNFNPMDMNGYSVSADYTVFSYRLYISSASQSSASFKTTATASQPIISITARSA